MHFHGRSVNIQSSAFAVIHICCVAVFVVVVVSSHQILTDSSGDACYRLHTVTAIYVARLPFALIAVVCFSSLSRSAYMIV